jgi:hypothetical protein
MRPGGPYRAWVRRALTGPARGPHGQHGGNQPGPAGQVLASLPALAARTPVRQGRPGYGSNLSPTGRSGRGLRTGSCSGWSGWPTCWSGEAASGQPAEELLRRLVRAVLEHQAGGLRDDATLLLVQWTGR